MASPEDFPTFADDGCVHVLVEAPAGTRSKLKYDPSMGAFVLHHVIPVGTAFPLDFGFIPGTAGDDGDPLDILVFTEEPTPVGMVVPSRLLGVVEAEQSEGNQPPERNDRLLAVARSSHAFEAWKSLDDVPQRILRGVEDFFVSYNAQRGVRFDIRGRGDLARAQALVREGQRRARR
jgi:inorganic pyrophosphatase